MASTPEGKVKKRISAILKQYEKDERLLYWMPVPTGYGTRQVDYIGVHLGRFFCIEAKRPGGRVTNLQEDFMRRVERAGGKSFVIDEDSDFATSDLREWLSGKGAIR